MVCAPSGCTVSVMNIYVYDYYMVFCNLHCIYIHVYMNMKCMRQKLARITNFTGFIQK